MYVYLTGERERASDLHTKYVAPAGDHRVSKVNVPQDWLDDEGKPRTFPVVFKFGRAEVDEGLGRYLVNTGQAAVSSIIRPAGRSLLGTLAQAMGATQPKTQF